MSTATFDILPEQVDEFRETGVLHLLGYVEMEQLRRIRWTVSAWSAAFALQHWDLHLPVSDSPSDFDIGYTELRAVDPAGAGRIYDAVKKIPEFMQWAADPRHVALARLLLSSEQIGVASRGWGMRIDHPGDTKHTTQLHQDYVSQLCSPRGIVIWSPLRDVTSEMGPVVMYPRSHAFGVFPVDALGPNSQDLLVRDRTSLTERFASCNPEVRAGDAVAIDFLLLHESGNNVSSQPRWSMLTRFFDAGHQGAIQMGWRGGLQEGNNFTDIRRLIEADSIE